MSTGPGNGARRKKFRRDDSRFKVPHRMHLCCVRIEWSVRKAGDGAPIQPVPIVPIRLVPRRQRDHRVSRSPGKGRQGTDRAPFDSGQGCHARASQALPRSKVLGPSFRGALTWCAACFGPATIKHAQCPVRRNAAVVASLEVYEAIQPKLGAWLIGGISPARSRVLPSSGDGDRLSPAARAPAAPPDRNRQPLRVFLPRCPPARASRRSGPPGAGR